MWQNNRIIARIISLILCFSLLLDLTPPVAWASYDDSEEIVSELEIAPEESTELEPDMEILEGAPPLLPPEADLPDEDTEALAAELEAAPSFAAPKEDEALKGAGGAGFLLGANEKYSITILQNENGTVECLNGEREIAGEEVVLTPIPNPDYMFDSWDVYYTDSEGKHPIEVSDLDTFTMPAANVSVGVRFKRGITLTVSLEWDDEAWGFTHPDAKVRLQKYVDGQWQMFKNVYLPASSNWTASVVVDDSPDAYRFALYYNATQIVLPEEGATAAFPVSRWDGTYPCRYDVAYEKVGNETKIKNTIRTKRYYFSVGWADDVTTKISPITAVLQKKNSTDGEWKTEEEIEAANTNNWLAHFQEVPDLVDTYRIRAKNGDGDLILRPEDEDYSGTKASYGDITYLDAAYSEGNFGTTLYLDESCEKSLTVHLTWSDGETDFIHEPVTVELRNESGEIVKVLTLSTDNNWSAEAPVEGDAGNYCFRELDSGDLPIDGGNLTTFPVKLGSDSYQARYRVDYAVDDDNNTTITNTLLKKRFTFKVEWAKDVTSTPPSITAALQRKVSADNPWDSQWEEAEPLEVAEHNNWQTISPEMPDLVGAYRLRAYNGSYSLILRPTDEDYEEAKASYGSITYWDVKYDETAAGTTLTLGAPYEKSLTVRLSWEGSAAGFTREPVAVVLLRRNTGDLNWDIDKRLTLSADNYWEAEVPIEGNAEYCFRELNSDDQIIAPDTLAALSVKSGSDIYQARHSVRYTVDDDNTTTITNTLQKKFYTFKVDWAEDASVKTSPITAVLQRKPGAEGEWQTIETRDAVADTNWQTSFPEVPDLVGAYRIRAKNGEGNLILRPGDEDYIGTTASYGRTTYRNTAYMEADEGTTLLLGDPYDEELTVRLHWADVGTGYTHAPASVELQKLINGNWRTVKELTLNDENGWSAVASIVGDVEDYKFVLAGSESRVFPVQKAGDTYQARYLVACTVEGNITTFTNTMQKKNYTIRAAWGEDADVKPDFIEVELERTTSGKWINTPDLRKRLSVDNNWQVTFTNVPDLGDVYRIRALNHQGRKIHHSADADYNPAEKAIFSAAKDGEKIYVTYNSVDYSTQNTLTILTLGDPEIQQELTVRLEWADVGGEYTHGNASVLLQKKNGDGWETVDTLTLSADSSWTASVQVAGYAADYRFRERSGGSAIDPNTQAAIPVVYGEDTYQANYTVSYQDAGTARTITNSMQTKDYTIRAAWSEDADPAHRPEYIRVELHRYSEASGSWVSVGNEKRIEAYEWQTAFTDVPDFGNVYRIRALNGLDGRNLILNQDDSDRDNGAPAVFHVTSVDDPAVIVTFDNVVYSVGADITTVSLSYQRLYANFSVEKVWDDAKASGVRPASLSVRLECRDAQDRHWTEKATISLSEANGWRADFPEVELNKEHFNLLFRAVELDESGEPVGSGSIAALKYDPFGGDVQPLAPNEEGEAAENLHLVVRKGNTPIHFRYQVQYGAYGTETAGRFPIANTLMGRVFPVEVVWENGQAPDSVKLVLQYRPAGENQWYLMQGSESELCAQDEWKGWLGPIDYAAGVEYRVRETSDDEVNPVIDDGMSGNIGGKRYKVSYAVDNEGKTIVTNTAANNYLVVMDWEHGELGDNAVSEPVTVVLQHRENGNWVEAARQALSENGEGEEERGADWRVAFAVPIDDDENYRVRELDGQGSPVEPGGSVVYSVEQAGSIVRAGYTAAYAYDAEHESFEITNTCTGKRVELTANVVWDDRNNQDGKRPLSVDVTLVADGDNPKGTKQAAQGNAWSCRFPDMPEKENGQDVEYSVLAANPDGYQREIARDGNVFTVTYTHEPEKTNINGSVIWAGDEQHQADRPQQVRVILRANDAEAGSANATAAAGWNFSFADKPKYANGLQIHYTVEQEHVDNYFTAVAGYIITNQHIDDDDDDGDDDDPDDPDPPDPEPEDAPLGPAGAAAAGAAAGAGFNGLIPYVAVGVGVVVIGFGIAALIYEWSRDTDVSGQVVWNHGDNPEGRWPEWCTVQLLADGEIVEDKYAALTVYENPDWKFTFSDVPRYYHHSLAETNYSVSPSAVKDYTATVNGTTVTYTYTPGKTSVGVNLIWDDANDQDAIRPESVEVMLTNGSSITKTLTLTAEDGWAGRFYDLDDTQSYNADVERTDVIADADGPGTYAVTVAGDKETGFFFKLTHTPVSADIHGTVLWEDDGEQAHTRPDGVTVTLMALLSDGEIVDMSTATDQEGRKFPGMVKYVTAADDWKVTFHFDQRPIPAQGGTIVWFMKEDPVPGYVTTVKGMTVTNTLDADTTDLTGKVIWEDDNNAQGDRPESVIVRLLANGERVDDKMLTVKGEGAEWSWAFTQLPKHDDKGAVIVYTVDEDTVPDYTTGIEGTTIRNTYAPEMLSLNIKKLWEGDGSAEQARPDSVTLHLFADGKEINPEGGEVTPNAGYEGIPLGPDESGKWELTIDGLRKYKSGSEILYTIEEDPVPDYDTVIDRFAITNLYAPTTITVEGAAVWNDDSDAAQQRPESITIRLYADGEELPDRTQTVTPDEDGNWTWTFTGLPRYRTDEQGQTMPVEYTIAEDPLPDYLTMVNGFNVINTFRREYREVTADVNWIDGDDRDGIRPASTVIRLLSDDAAVEGQTMEISALQDWKCVFTGLPKYEKGVKINYTVEEEKTSVLTGTDGPGTYGIRILPMLGSSGSFVVENTHTPETVTVEGVKTWVDQDNAAGKRPGSITIRLLADGESVEGQVRTVTPDAQGDWKWSFPDLPKYSGGSEILYSVSEDSVEGYTAEVDDASVTNTYTPGETQVDVVLSWDDDKNRDGIRPDSVAVLLTKGETETGQTLVLNEANEWQGTFAGLDPGSYGVKVQKTDVITGQNRVGTYADLVREPVSGGADYFSVRLIHTPVKVNLSGSKTWDDNDNDEDKRPESITIRLLADGELVEGRAANVTPDEHGDWKWSFNTLPKYKDGKEITYSVHEDAVKGYTSAVDGMNVTNTLIPSEPRFMTSSLLLSGLIGMNVFMDLPGRLDKYSTSYMVFEVNGKEEIVPFDPSFRNSAGLYFGFTGHVNSIQMAEPITCTFHYGENGEKTVGRVYKVSEYIEECVQEYADYPRVVALANALGNYGHYVQPILSQTRHWTIGVDYQEMFATSEITDDMIRSAAKKTKPFAMSTTKDKGSKAKFTYSLNLESGTEIYVFIRPEAGTTVTASVDGTQVSAELLSDGRYLVIIPNIPARELDKRHLIHVEAGSEAFDIDLCALSYVNAVLNADFPDIMQEAVTSLFNYYQAAAAYVPNDS